MVTTIQISSKLQAELAKRKIYAKETYEEVIWDILEDTMELSHETKRNISKVQKEFNEGKFKTFEEVVKELNLWLILFFFYIHPLKAAKKIR